MGNDKFYDQFQGFLNLLLWLGDFPFDSFIFINKIIIWHIWYIIFQSSRKYKKSFNYAQVLWQSNIVGI